MPTLRQTLRASTYFAAPALGVASPLIVYPSVTGAFGATGFASIAIGQSLGLSFAVIAELGWALTGPRQVSDADQETRSRLALLSVYSSALVLVPVMAIAAPLAAILAPSHAFAAAMTAAASLTTALSLNWFFVGTGRPLSILMTDSLPKVAASVVAAAIIAHASGPLFIFPLCVLAGNLAGIAAALQLTKNVRILWHSVTIWACFQSIREQFVVTLGRSASALYLSLPVTLVAVVNPISTATFAAVDRLLRLTLSLIGPAPNVFQRWVGVAQNTHDKVSRVRFALVANAVLGITGGVGFALLAPTCAQLLMSGTITVEFVPSVLAGCVVLITCISRSTGGIALVHAGRAPTVAASGMAGAAAGVPLLMFMTKTYGTNGALSALAITETFVLLVQLVALARLWRARAAKEPQ